MSRPVVVMLLTRHPYAHKSGRGFTLPQRIEQVRRLFDVRLVAFATPAGDASDEGILFLPLARPMSLLLNMVRLWRLPMQTWLYYNEEARRRVSDLCARSGASALYIDMIRLAPFRVAAPRGAAVVMDFDDLLSERYRHAALARGYEVMGFLAGRMEWMARLARLFSRPLLHMEAVRCAAYERALYPQVDVAVVVSAREGAKMRDDGARILIVPPVLVPRSLMPRPGRRLVFLGNMRYAENIAMIGALAQGAAALDAEGAWPHGVMIEAVGDHAADLPGRLNSPHVTFLGRIADLGELAGAGVFLAPVSGGSGVKLKVLDGMALGCPVVATPKACEGLSARPNRDLLVARDAKEVLRAALALRGRAWLMTAIAKRGRAYLERAHAPSRGDALADTIADAITSARRRQEML